MNIEPDIFDYLQTTSLEPHDDYTSEITYKDQKIIWTRLQYQDKEIERLNNIINNIENICESSIASVDNIKKFLHYNTHKFKLTEADALAKSVKDILSLSNDLVMID